MTAFDMVRRISPNGVLYFEQCLYALADKQVEGYNGGVWVSKQLPNNMAYVVVPGEGDCHVMVASNYADEKLDRASAGAALTIVALNKTLWKLSERNQDVGALNDLFYNLKNAVFDDASLNHTAIFNIID